jgi:hypothetical protein
VNRLVARPRWARWWAAASPWLRRYAPCEALSTFGAFGCAWLALTVTGSLAAAAVGGVVGGTVGFYAVPAVRAFRGYRAMYAGVGGRRAAVALGLTTRSLLVEFGPAECVDSALVRPGLLYLGPMVLGSPFAGWFAGKVVADTVFYVITGWSLRRNRRLIEPVGP